MNSFDITNVLTTMIGDLSAFGWRFGSIAMVLVTAVVGPSISGVDSVVLLDLLSHVTTDLVVAHFDHGIRPDSDIDARFVRALYSASWSAMRNA